MRRVRSEWTLSYEFFADVPLVKYLREGDRPALFRAAIIAAHGEPTCEESSAALDRAVNDFCELYDAGMADGIDISSLLMDAGRGVYEKLFNDSLAGLRDKINQLVAAELDINIEALKEETEYE